MFVMSFFLFACHHVSSVESGGDSPCVTGPQPTESLATVMDKLLPIEETMDEVSNKTGVLVLEEGLQALLLRGWLAEQAQQSIDIQYFIFSADNVGMIAMANLLEAADRGVHIRLIVDDVLAHGDELLLRDMDVHPNIEVKVFNPNINIGKHWTEKSKNLVTQFDAINQRMHHKTFIVDGMVSVTGGRNVADEYYDLDSVYNFRDRDVALFGGVVSSISEGFAFFWEDPHSVPMDSLLAHPSIEIAEVSWNTLRTHSCSPSNFLPQFRTKITEMPEYLYTTQENGTLVWVDTVQYISDAPWKNEVEGFNGGSITTRELLSLLDSATERIWIQTPYLVLSDVGLGALQQARNKGIEVKILTNSLAATDNYPAFAGYKKIRGRLLDMGVEVFEIMPNAPDVHALNKTGIPNKVNADVGLHAKSMLIDHDVAVIGSFNMDPRSANLNTESIVVIRDKRVHEQMEFYFVREMHATNAWPAHQNNEKHAGPKRRILTWLSQIVPEFLL